MKKQTKEVIAKPKKTLHKKDVNYQFLPNSELLEIAKKFSDNYKKFRVGEYFSDSKKYHIKYLARIKDQHTGKALTTGARISNITGIIELDKFIYKSKEYTSDFIFFIILWCVACNEQQNKGDMKMADKMAVEYYLTTERSKKNLALGYIELFSKAPTKLNKERYEVIEQFLKDYTQPFTNLKNLKRAVAKKEI